MYNAIEKSLTPPRKVVVGTLMKSFWGPYEGLGNRLKELSECIDHMAQQSNQKGYCGKLDLVVLPENAICDENLKEASEKCVPFEGAIHDAFRAKAQEHNTYIIIPFFLNEKGTYSNAAILIDRSGDIVGIYRKTNPVLPRGGHAYEGGVIIGTENPVFECDFGRVGIQICFDIHFGEGWHTLSEQGAEIVAWPTQSPQVVQPASRAEKGDYYIISSTWRDNASIFEPSGLIAAQTETDPILVHQIDLSYAVLPWQPRLQQGELLKKHYGDRAGYHYSTREDRGLFWSNDDQIPIGEMIRELNLEHRKELFCRYEKGLQPTS